MNCPRCRFENREGVKFCEECGSKLELVCPGCGAKIPLGKKFCGECGYQLTKPLGAPPMDYSAPQSYTPKHLADKILNTRRSLEGERKLVTVMFADVAGFTALSEKLDPEEVHQIMDGCCRILMDEIHRFEGTINQFTGDGVMALFGAPMAHEDHAQRACYAALAIQKALVEYSEKVNRRLWRWISRCASASTPAGGGRVHRGRSADGLHGHRAIPSTWPPAWRAWPSPGRCFFPGTPSAWSKTTSI